MRLRTFHAATMKQAMELIREELGDSAVILSSNKSTLGKGVSVTVAQDSLDDEDDDDAYDHAQASAYASPQRHASTPLSAPRHAPSPITSSASFTSKPATAPHKPTAKPAPRAHPHYVMRDRDLEESLDSGFALMPDYIIRDVEDTLYRHGTGGQFTDVILNALRRVPAPRDTSPESMRYVLAECIRQSCRFVTIPYTQTGLRMMTVGTPGAGKTLMIAKLAARIVQAGQHVHVITTDFKRAGGVEQLASFTDILGIQLHVANTRAELKDILTSIPQHERVLMDSAGANPYDFQELKELSEFAGLMGVEPVLVFPAGGDPAEASEVAHAFSFLGVERMIITRTDLARRYGSLLTAAHSAGLAFSYITGTEQVLGECNHLTPETLAAMLLSYKKT
jgi:flagellar biosynthesis protein FlhF